MSPKMPPRYNPHHPRSTTEGKELEPSREEITRRSRGLGLASPPTPTRAPSASGLLLRPDSLPELPYSSPGGKIFYDEGWESKLNFKRAETPTRNPTRAQTPRKRPTQRLKKGTRSGSVPEEPTDPDSNKNDNGLSSMAITVDDWHRATSSYGQPNIDNNLIDHSVDDNRPLPIGSLPVIPNHPKSFRSPGPTLETRSTITGKSLVDIYHESQGNIDSRTFQPKEIRPIHSQTPGVDASTINGLNTGNSSGFYQASLNDGGSITATPTSTSQLYSTEIYPNTQNNSRSQTSMTTLDFNAQYHQQFSRNAPNLENSELNLIQNPLAVGYNYRIPTPSQLQADDYSNLGKYNPNGPQIPLMTAPNTLPQSQNRFGGFLSESPLVRWPPKGFIDTNNHVPGPTAMQPPSERLWGMNNGVRDIPQGANGISQVYYNLHERTPSVPAQPDKRNQRDLSEQYQLQQRQQQKQLMDQQTWNMCHSQVQKGLQQQQQHDDLMQTDHGREMPQSNPSMSQQQPQVQRPQKQMFQVQNPQAQRPHAHNQAFDLHTAQERGMFQPKMRISQQQSVVAPNLPSGRISQAKTGIVEPHIIELFKSGLEKERQEVESLKRKCEEEMNSDKDDDAPQQKKQRQYHEQHLSGITSPPRNFGKGTDQISGPDKQQLDKTLTQSRTPIQIEVNGVGGMRKSTKSPPRPSRKGEESPRAGEKSEKGVAQNNGKSKAPALSRSRSASASSGNKPALSVIVAQESSPLSSCIQKHQLLANATFAGRAPTTPLETPPLVYSSASTNPTSSSMSVSPMILSPVIQIGPTENKNTIQLSPEQIRRLTQQPITLEELKSTPDDPDYWDLEAFEDLDSLWGDFGGHETQKHTADSSWYNLDTSLLAPDDLEFERPPVEEIWHPNPPVVLNRAQDFILEAGYLSRDAPAILFTPQDDFVARTDCMGEDVTESS